MLKEEREREEHLYIRVYVNACLPGDKLPNHCNN